MTTTERAAFAARWWADLLARENARVRADRSKPEWLKPRVVVSSEQVEVFRAALERALAESLAQEEDGNDEPHAVKVQVDYDPFDVLLDALRTAGIPCLGCLFSAEGLLPAKTRMWIARDKIEVAMGYGATPEVIWPKESK